MLFKMVLFLFAVRLLCLGAPEAVERQAETLQAVLGQADDAYYNRAQPIMSDAAYDALRERYNELLVQYPELAQASSVGAPVGNIPGRVDHAFPVLSLEKAYSDGEVSSFVSRCGRESRYCVEPKLDGLTLVLHYQKGLLTQAVTRGDGKSGMDVTRAVIASGAVPVLLDEDMGQFVVRGELFMSWSAFDSLNRRRAEDGLARLKSPRNTAAGTLRLSDPVEISRRGLQFSAFELRAADHMPETHTEALALIKSAGIPIVESHSLSGVDVLAAVERCRQRFAASSMPCDGVVIKLDEYAACKKQGATEHHPRGAMARKYHQAAKESRLLSVEWKKGETGKLTPVAHFKPVEIDGVTIQNASLYNLAYIRAMDLKLGDWIHVIRAGGSVPEVTGNIPERRTGTEQDIPCPE